MTKSKNTKSALLMSVLALMLCVVMLAGSTFAWFTDSVETSKSKIVAGNLDVALYYKNGTTGDYQPVEANTNVFMEGALWEPGHVEVVYLKVANLGSLALKYSLGLNIAKETPGISVATGEEFKLSNYIEYALLDGEQTFETDGALDRSAAVAAAQEENENRANPISGLKVVKTGDLNPGTDEATSEKCVTLVVYMPETVDNAANYREKQPSIELGINLVATQATVENDSFGNNYDDEAKKLVPTKIVYNKEDLRDALTNAKTGDVIGIGPGEYDLGMINYQNKNITLLGLTGEGEEKVTLTTKFNQYNATIELHNINVTSSAQGAMLMGKSSFKMYGGSISTVESPAVSTYSDTKDAKIELYNVKITSKSTNGNEGRQAFNIGGENTYCYLKDCDVFGYSVFTSGNVVIEGGKFSNVKSTSGYYETYNTVNDQIDGKDYLNNEEAIAILNDSRPNENIGDAIRFDNRNGNLQSVVVKDVQFDLRDPQAGTNFYLFGIRYLGNEGTAPELTFENLSSNFDQQIVIGQE